MGWIDETTWDHIVDEATSEFDSETDADGDLNANATAVHTGTNGFEVTFDDANVAYGTITATAIDQTEGTIDMWFNHNDVTITDGNNMNIVAFRDGAGNNEFVIQFERSGSDYVVHGQYRTDSGFSNMSSTITLPASALYVRMRLVFKRSTGPGNDDGFIHLYVDDGSAISTISDTDIDNDSAADWDEVRVGMLGASQSSGFGGSFYFDEVKVQETERQPQFAQQLLAAF